MRENELGVFHPYTKNSFKTLIQMYSAQCQVIIIITTTTTIITTINVDVPSISIVKLNNCARDK